jgi:hypothetical protein
MPLLSRTRSEALAAHLDGWLIHLATPTNHIPAILRITEANQNSNPPTELHTYKSYENRLVKKIHSSQKGVVTRTKQSWKWTRSKPAAWPMSFLKIFLSSFLMMDSSLGQLESWKSHDSPFTIGIDE